MARDAFSITMRRSLKQDIDQLALEVGQSRSEVIGRILGIVMPGLRKKDLDWIRVRRSMLIDTLKI